MSHTWTLRQASRDTATLRYTIEADGVVTLEGRIGEDSVTMHLRRVDSSKFPLLLGP